MAIPCKDRVEHRPIAWAVLGRDVCRLSGHPELGEWPTPGISTLTCKICHVAWRSAAQYVKSLPDLHPAYVDPIWTQLCWFVRTYPLTVELTYWQQPDSLAGRNKFLRDVGRQFTEAGWLSERQLNYVEMAVVRTVARANDKALAAQLAAAKQVALLAELGSRVAPEGPTVVLGLVQRVFQGKYFDDAPDVPKMVVLADEGYEVEGTVPAGILRRVGTLDELVGRRVKLHADLRPRSDITKAWASRPRPTSTLLD